MTKHVHHTRRLRRTGLGAALAATMALGLACGADAPASGRGGAEPPGGYPRERLNWTIAFGPGGGNDIMARTLIDILQRHDLYPGAIIATNRPAGSGAQGWGYLFAQPGNPYHISTTSGSFITTPLQARTPWKPTSFTPVALLATDDAVLIVPGKSAVKSVADFVVRSRQKSPAIGGMGSVNVNFMVAHLFARAAGFELRYVPFNSQGELTAAMLSGSLDAMVSNPGAILGLIRSGDFRPLAFSGTRSPRPLESVPTFAQAGYPQITLSMPRGLVLPPDISPDVQRWWIDTMKKVVETPEWAAYVEANLLTPDVRFGSEFQEYLTHTSTVFEQTLRETGVIR